MPPFQLNYLDHVAIRVSDLQASADWYEKVLGLKRVHPKAWRPFPILLLTGSSGVALFPKNKKTEEEECIQSNCRTIDHFAFRVSNTGFEAAKKWLNNLHIEYDEQGHHYFHSIYLTDPD